MAISAGDWASATDPFILADDVTYTGTLGELSNARIRVYNTTGLMNGIIDKDIQDLFWEKDGDKESSWSVNAMQTMGTGPAAGYDEFGGFDYDVGGGTFYRFQTNDQIESDTKDARIYVTGRSAGAVLYSLYCYVAYAWTERDPAQILFSWIAHYLDNSIFTMKDYVDQTSLAAASDYYDLNPCGLSLWRETGMTIAEQTKKLFNHVSDFLAIRPASSGGAVKLNVIPRGAMEDRTTVIDIESKSVKSYTIRPTDRYRLDRIDATFGSITMIHSDANGGDDPSDYMTAFPIEFPSNSRNMVSQKVGAETADNKLVIDLPYHRTRSRVVNHVDIGFWHLDQDEVEIEFADWLHLNWEAGDQVHISGRGYDGTENFVVVEKVLDIDNMTAMVRLIQVLGSDGKRPVYADAANLILSLRPNTMGNWVDGASTYPKQVAYIADPRNLDRWWDESPLYSHAQQINRGTGGVAGANPGPPMLTLNAVNKWPVLDFDGTMGMKHSAVFTDGLGAPHTSGTSNYTLYAVVRVDNTAAALMSLWAYSYSGNILVFDFASGSPRYNSGAGSVGPSSALGGWQIVVWTLTSGASTIRRNGANIFSGGAYTALALSELGSFAIGTNYAGSLYMFDGAIAELHMFKTAHAVGTSQLIEAHLAEKYAIAI